MKLSGQNQHLKWKRAISRVLALFFVLYALADITVLQVYCGNETVGIPPYAQQIQIKQKNKKTNSLTFAVADSSSSSRQEHTPDLPASEESCFCCCSHITIGFNFIQSVVPEILPTKQSKSNFSENRLQSNSHLPQLYQPPKFA
jgi:hypothetical protein